MGKDVIVACDFSSKADVMNFLDKFNGEGRKPFVKIGMELFYAEGPQIVKEIKERGHKIFLDLKLHDIPNTVKKSMAVLSGLDVDMTNLHASGTIAMMEAALEGLTRPDGSRPILIAVTQLTSTSQERMEEDLLIKEDIKNTVISYGKEAGKIKSNKRKISFTDKNDVCRIDIFIKVQPLTEGFDTKRAEDELKKHTEGALSKIYGEYGTDALGIADKDMDFQINVFMAVE